MNIPSLSLSVAEALLRTETEKKAGKPKTTRPPCAIAISREPGADGSAVAREIGQRLGCPVYDREIVEKVAEELRKPASELRKLDERPTFWIEDWVSGLGQENAVSADTYVRHLVAAVRGIAEVGRCVIVGRGAPRILRHDRTLCVRLIGDRDKRIANLRADRQWSVAEATERVDRIEEERIEFIKRNFGIDPRDPHLYDLVLNTSRLSVAGCAELVTQAFLRFEALVS